jgi:hypothetical protein
VEIRLTGILWTAELKVRCILSVGILEYTPQCVSTLRIKKNKAVSVASQEIGLEVNAEKTGYIFVFCDRNAGKCHSIKIGNESRENVTKFKYWDKI